MRKYETVFISDPDLQDQARTELFEKVRNIITRENGLILNFDEWGNKKLAYEIKKKLRGHYVCLTYGGTGDLVKELERNFRLSDDVMKFMTILLSQDVTVEELEEEAREAAAAASAAAEAAAREEAAAEESKKAEADESEEADVPAEAPEAETAEAETAETEAVETAEPVEKEQN